MSSAVTTAQGSGPVNGGISGIRGDSEPSSEHRQSFEALVHANRVRNAIAAELKRIRKLSYAEARMEIASIVVRNDLATAGIGGVPMARLIRSIPSVGNTKAQRLLRAADISANPRLRQVSPMRRVALAEELRKVSR